MLVDWGLNHIRDFEPIHHSDSFRLYELGDNTFYPARLDFLYPDPILEVYSHNRNSLDRTDK